MKLFVRLSLIACLLAPLSGYTQDAKAKAILDELSNTTRKYTSITSDFTFSLDDEAADVHQSQEGQIKMKGKKYYVLLGENQVYSDGTTRWTYSEEMEEVYVDNVAGSDDVLDPSEIYTVWESGFKHYYVKESTLNGRTIHIIKLVPIEPDEESFHTVRLYIDKAKMEVLKIEILGKQGDNITYSVKSFKSDIPYSDSDFVFDLKEHPGVTEIDNR